MNRERSMSSDEKLVITERLIRHGVCLLLFVCAGYAVLGYFIRGFSQQMEYGNWGDLMFAVSFTFLGVLGLFLRRFV